MKRTVCFLSARNLGDAVIHADFVRSLVRYGYADKLIVWTFKAAAFAFADIPNCDLVFSDFPMGATRNAFFKNAGISFLSAVRHIRSRHPDETIELVSDVRERFAAKLLGAPVNYSLDWAENHPFRRHSRTSKRPNGSWTTIPASIDNIYAAFTAGLQHLVRQPDAGFSPNIKWQTLAAIAASQGTIGIHPSASMPHKLWPDAYWADLISSIHADYPAIRFVLFGAPADRTGLEHITTRVRDLPVEIVTGSLREFKTRVADVAVLVGLDSFSVHLAQSLGLPSVVLVGSNNPTLFSPPGSRIAITPGSCLHQPCNGKPRCVSTEFEYACMKSIAPAQVVRILDLGHSD